jgi:hypothetical protein
LLDLLYKHIYLDRAVGKAEVLFESGQNVAKERGIFGGLSFGEVQHQRRPILAQALVVIHHEESRIHDRCGETTAPFRPDVAVVQVKAAGAEDFGGEAELLDPIVNDRLAEKAFAPGVHFLRDILGCLHENVVAMDRQLQVTLIVERHRRDLAERILAVKHPTIGSGEERIGDIANAFIDRRIRLRRRPRPLNPLPPEVIRNLAADEVAVTRILYFDIRASDCGGRVQEPNSFFVPEPRCTPRRAAGQYGPAFRIKFRQHFECIQCLWRVNIRIFAFKIASNFKRTGSHESPLAKNVLRILAVMTVFGNGAPKPAAKTRSKESLEAAGKKIQNRGNRAEKQQHFQNVDEPPPKRWTSTAWQRPQWEELLGWPNKRGDETHTANNSYRE